MSGMGEPAIGENKPAQKQMASENAINKKTPPAEYQPIFSHVSNKTNNRTNDEDYEPWVPYSASLSPPLGDKLR